jgi:hypothetical protein
MKTSISVLTNPAPNTFPFSIATPMLINIWVLQPGRVSVSAWYIDIDDAVIDSAGQDQPNDEIGRMTRRSYFLVSISICSFLR